MTATTGTSQDAGSVADGTAAAAGGGHSARPRRRQAPDPLRPLVVGAARHRDGPADPLHRHGRRGVLRLHRLDRDRRLRLHRPRQLPRIFDDPALIGSLKNTLFLAFGFLIATNVLGLLLALALNRTLKTRYFLRVLFFMPVVLSPLAVSYIWKFIFDFNGPLNEAIGWFGMEPRTWLADPTSPCGRSWWSWPGRPPAW